MLSAQCTQWLGAQLQRTGRTASLELSQLGNVPGLRGVGPVRPGGVDQMSTKRRLIQGVLEDFGPKASTKRRLMSIKRRLRPGVPEDFGPEGVD